MATINAAPRPPSEAGPSAVDGVMRQLAILLGAARASPYRRPLGWLAAGIGAVICANTLAQILLVRWQGAFYDALSQKLLREFGVQLLVFLAIAGALLALVVAQTWLQEMTKVRLREWLTNDLLDQWLVPKRAYLLGFAGQIGVNPDQRIHQDTQRLTELTTILAVGLLQASLLLISFVGVLWALSAQVVFELGGRSLVIPGYMVWCALAYSLGGSLLAWRIGRPLIPLNAERYAREAELRFALVSTNEHADGVALHGGEADERRTLGGTLERVVTLMVTLARGLARLTWVTSGYGWLAMVVPIIVAAPGYFGGGLSFGGLMMVVGAFNQVQQSLRWFVDNLAQIADWRATLLRVVAFRSALPTVEAIGADAGRIEIVESTSDRLVVENLEIALPNESATLDQPRLEVRPGERVQILGDAGAGKSTLFRMLAGMWPWGAGTVELPPQSTMAFLPQRPYLPYATLRAAISYPAPPDRFEDAVIVSTLARMALGHLAPLLDRTDRWGRQLPLDEQQRLACVRLLLHAPRWVMLDDAISALSESHRRLVLSLVHQELQGVALIRLGRDPVLDGFWDRTLHIIAHPGGRSLTLGL
jgi:putative ATP-binding cassette transporter